MYLSDISALRAITSLPIPIEEFIVAGYYTSGDGGGGTFTWVDDLTPPNDDGGIIIRTPFGTPLHNDGYFKRLYSGPINVRWFGAKGDGVTDDTAAVHAARDSQFCKDGGTLYFPESKDSNGNVTAYVGAFEFTHVTGEVNIIGDGAASMLQSNGSTTGTDPNPVLRLGWAPWWWRSKTVSNLIINGTPPGGPGRFSDGIMFDDSENPMSAGRWTISAVVGVITNNKS